MKKALLFIAAAAMFVLAGCQKEQAVQESKSNNVIHINVKQMGPATKVAAVDIDAENLSFKFEEGDEVAFLNGNTLKITEFTCTNPATGEFEKTNGDALDPDGEYLVAYPVFAPDYLFISEGVYPQNYRANQIPKEHVILANGGEPVSGASTEFNLDYHFGIIHFQLKGNAKIGSIEYQCKDGEGEYDEVSTILSCGEGVQLSDTPTHFYMDVISTTSSGFKLIFKDASGNELGKQESNFKLNANKGKIVDFATPITVNASSEPEYVVMKMGTGEGAYTLKWATMNLGATTVAGSYTTCYGDLYQWGSVNTLYDGFPWISATEGSFTWKTDKTSGFDSSNREYTGNDATLPDANDVVKQTYPGTNWRMPTSQEFKDLHDACLNSSYDTSTNPSGASASVGKGVYWCTNYDGVAGCLFCDGTNKLFFPAAGYGSGKNIANASLQGYYWSSSLRTAFNIFAYYLNFTSDSVNPQSNIARYSGISVRPVKDVPTE